MYEYFYLTVLIGAILLCITTLVSSVIAKKYLGICRKVQYGLIVITVVALIGFIVTLAL